MLYIGILEVVSSLIDIYVINSFLTRFIKHLHTQFQNKEGRSYLYYFFHTFKNHANDLFLFLNWISTSLNVTCFHNYQEIYPCFHSQMTPFKLSCILKKYFNNMKRKATFWEKCCPQYKKQKIRKSGQVHGITGNCPCKLRPL